MAAKYDFHGQEAYVDGYEDGLKDACRSMCSDCAEGKPVSLTHEWGEYSFFIHEDMYQCRANGVQRIIYKRQQLNQNK
jgi:hypothetical protein